MSQAQSMVDIQVHANPLNPRLYHSLRRKFEKVKICNEGQRHLEKATVDPYDPSRRRMETINSGEHYRVCCPYCGDTRYRLYVCYRWNTQANGKTYGRRLIQCFNEHCGMRDFDEMIKPYIGRDLPHLRRPDVKLDNTELFGEVALPGRCVPLNQLPDSHPAIRYVVKDRKFAVNDLWENWQVHFCVDCGPDDAQHPGLVRNRLIIPIFWQGKLVGWQSRAIDDRSQPKYYTMPGLVKSQMLFNGDRARAYKFGVVVEGVFDAFRAGPRAVALLGAEISGRQRELLLNYWQTGSVCLILDPEALEDLRRLEKMKSMLGPKNFRWGSFILELPPGEDPGSMKHDDLWHLIVEHARTRNIPLASM